MKAKVLIVDVYKITGIGVVPVGPVKEGVFRVGMKANIGGRIMEVKSIEMHHQQMIEAHVGDNIGFVLKNGDSKALDSVRGSEVEFSDEGPPVPAAPTNSRATETHPEPIKPEGFWDSLKRVFGGRK